MRADGGGADGENPPGRFEIHGHAIVSADDCIADANGRFPPELSNDADWSLFQAELDLASLVVLGRASHEATPNARRRRRLVMSRSVSRLEAREDALWWNPAALPFADAMAEIGLAGGRIAVPGGQGAFDHFLALGFDAFHLSRAARVRLPGGRRLFGPDRAAREAEPALVAAGLVPAPVRCLDADAGVTFTLYAKAAAALVGPSAPAL